MQDKCFEFISPQRGRAEFVFGQLFRDSLWAAQAGTLAELLSQYPRLVRLDFTSTIWGDPFPLLSLACLLRNFQAMQKDAKIVVDLGKPRSTDRENRFVVYAATQGFFSLLGPAVVIKWNGDEFAQDNLTLLESKLGKLDRAVIYKNSDCIKAKCFSVSQLKSTRLPSVVETLVEEARVSCINRWLADNARQRSLLLQKLRILLTEGLDNIAEHAYVKGGFGSVFVRIRAGAPDDPEEMIRWNSAYENERKYCPTLNRCNCGKMPGWLEVFICDSGIGLATTLAKESKAPLLTVSNQLFREPISRYSDRQLFGKTKMTGLQHMGFMLNSTGEEQPSHRDEQRGDFVRVYSAGEWAGDHLQWPNPPNTPEHLNNRDQPCAPGTLLQFAIEPPPPDWERQRKIYPSYFVVPNYNDLPEVREALSVDHSALFAPNYAFVDLHIGSYARSARRGVAAQVWINQIKESKVIIRPSRATRKVDIVSQLRQLGQNQQSRINRLVFADVPWSIAIDLSNILKNEKLPVPWPSSDLQIVVIAQDWCCAAFSLELDRQTLRPDPELAKSFLRASGGTVGGAIVASVLRDRDTELLWEDVGAAYLNEHVIWKSATDDNKTREIVIDGYLDIALAILTPSARDAAKRALRRAVSSFGYNFVMASNEAVQILLGDEFIVHDGNEAMPQMDPPRQVVIVGGVLISGRTSDRYTRRDDIEPLGRVHLARHVNSSAPNKSSLPSVHALRWTPKVRTKHVVKLCERIPDSPFILRGGDLAIPLPRFQPPNGKKLGNSLYGEPPSVAYQRWQHLGLLRMGHWSYPLHHDLLTVNLADALAYDQAEGGPIIPWLIDILNKWQAECRRNGHSCAVVYTHHQITDKLVRLVRSRMSKPPPFFPLQLIRNSTVSPRIVSPMQRERLGQYLVEYFQSGGLIVQIDDWIITGKTLVDLRHVIEGMWEALKSRGTIRKLASLELRTLAIVERSGLPNQRDIVARQVKTDPRFWRWDVPSMGQEESCPLCASLDRSRNLNTAIVNSELKARLNEWNTLWQTVTAEHGLFEAGLRPKRISRSDSTRFCIDKISDNRIISDTIVHQISTSRAAIAAEICRSTTRKDYALEKSRAEEHDLQTRIEVLASQVLLFLKDLSYLDRVDRILTMLDLLWSADDPSPATALAGLTVMVDPDLTQSLWTHCSRLIEAKGFPNIDTLIVASFLFRLAPKKTVIKWDNEHWRLLQLIVVPIMVERGSLSRVFQVFGWDETSIHRGLVLDLLKLQQITANDLHHIFLMLEELANAIADITLEMTAGLGLVTQTDVENLRGQISELRNFAGRCQPFSMSIADKHPDLKYVILTCDRDPELNKELHTRLHKIYSMLFTGTKSLQSQYRSALTIKLTAGQPANLLLEPAIRQLDHDWANLSTKSELIKTRWADTKPLIIFPTDFQADKTVHVYFDRLVRRSVAEAVANVIHRTHRIVCPWPGNEALGLADMWARVHSASGSHVIIELANGVEIGSKIPPPPRGSHLRSIGGDIRFKVNNIGSILTTLIVVPTIGGLAWRGTNYEI